MRCFSGIEETLRPMLHSFHESIPLRCITGVEILQGGLCVTKIQVNVRIQFFGTDNQVVQLFVVHHVGYSLQFS